jgi:FixJ family two-component response regulator
MAAQRTIVIVDDNPAFLKSVARLLSVHGLTVRTFSSAEALLDQNCIPAATCLLLDIHLGGISGIELHRRLAATGSTCPVIFMSAIEDDNTRKEAMAAGCIAYLRKPFTPQLLLEAIGRAAA